MLRSPSSKLIKVAVTGATGQISYALQSLLQAGQVFGHQSLDLMLYDIPAALPALRALEMEMIDCASPFINSVAYTCDLAELMEGANRAILLGAARRTGDMTRAELLEVNGPIFVEQGEAIAKYAADDIQTLVVGNPCNTNALITANAASTVPSERFFAMTMLDQNRAVAQLAAKAGVSVSEVTDLYVWGNHSATQYPDFYSAKISGRPVVEVIQDHRWLLDDFLKTNRGRGKAVIDARGASSAFSAAKAVADTMLGLEGLAEAPISVASYATGEHYNIPEGIICSTPWHNGEVVAGIELNSFAMHQLHQSVLELQEEA